MHAPNGTAGTASANASGTSTPVTVALNTVNSTGTPRTARITFAAGNLTKTITVAEVLI